MFLFTIALLYICAAVSESYSGQLTCPYSTEAKSLPRIFCKRDANNHNCCTGISFSPGISKLYRGQVSVKDSGNTFTVSVQSLFQGEGVYWCGLKNGTRTIIKLAEGNLFDDQMNFVWSIGRWIGFLLLLLALILTHFVCCMKKRRGEKGDE